MSSRDKRLCPGVDGRKCGAHMSPVVKDPHPRVLGVEVGIVQEIQRVTLAKIGR